MLPRLNSLWIGEQLGYLERLTLASALSVGHSFTLYSYAPEKLREVPTRGGDSRRERSSAVRDACSLF